MKKILIITFILISTILTAQSKSILDRQAKNLDALLKIATEQVQALKIKAELYYAPPHKPTSIWFKYLKDIPSKNVFCADTVPTVLQGYCGNLTGAGSIKNRSDEFYQDINMSLDLYSQFVITMYLVPNAQWVYFVSVDRFYIVYPWVPSSQLHYTDASLKEPFLDLGTPENNPDRSLFWTPIYLDEAGMGLMVTLSAPIYNGDTFKGTVSLDLTLRELNQILKKMVLLPNDKTFVLLINDQQEILAHPSSNLPDNKIFHLCDILPPELKNQPDIIKPDHENQIYEVGDYIIRYVTLKHAPWKLVFIHK